jgi:hypothetical protein
VEPIQISDKAGRLLDLSGTDETGTLIMVHNTITGESLNFGPITNDQLVILRFFVREQLARFDRFRERTTK